MADTVRLDRLLVARGLGSRREVGMAVRRGRVTVDGAIVRKPDAHVAPDAPIAWDGEAVEVLPDVVAWHKPVGVLSTLRDPWGREGLEAALPPAWRGAFHPVGRLDKDTSGLLLFSRDGAITQHLLHPRRAIPRTYRATVEVDPPPTLVDALAAGVETGEGTFTAEVVAIDGRDVTLVVREGKHRMVRRMLHNAGASVVGLHRLAYGAATLGELPEGEARALSDVEVEALLTT